VLFKSLTAWLRLRVAASVTKDRIISKSNAGGIEERSALAVSFISIGLFI
jgi:hypothetical protein